MKRLDLTNLIFGRLTVVGPGPKMGKKNTWHCTCSCGGKSLAYVHDLRSGRHQSCGCLHIDRVTKHGHATRDTERSHEYSCWAAMKTRCNPEYAEKFPYHAGKGVAVCEKWAASFTAFFDDVGPAPSTDHSLDRYPDQHGNYEPGNVRWATRSEQQSNRRDTKLIEYLGKSQTLAAWIRELGLNENSVRARIRLGWSYSEAFERPRWYRPSRA